MLLLPQCEWVACSLLLFENGNFVTIIFWKDDLFSCGYSDFKLFFSFEIECFVAKSGTFVKLPHGKSGVFILAIHKASSIT